jgi:hypothetical protein
MVCTMERRARPSPVISSRCRNTARDIEYTLIRDGFCIMKKVLANRRSKSPKLNQFLAGTGAGAGALTPAGVASGRGTRRSSVRPTCSYRAARGLFSLSRRQLRVSASQVVAAREQSVSSTSSSSSSPLPCRYKHASSSSKSAASAELIKSGVITKPSLSSRTGPTAARSAWEETSTSPRRPHTSRKVTFISSVEKICILSIRHRGYPPRTLCSMQCIYQPRREILEKRTREITRVHSTTEITVPEKGKYSML